jgi:hypothetical protein
MAGGLVTVVTGGFLGRRLCSGDDTPCEGAAHFAEHFMPHDAVLAVRIVAYLRVPVALIGA